MTATEILRAARVRITDPKHWTQGNFAHDECGDPVSPTSPRASRWCAIGALDATGAVNGFGRALKFLSNAVEEKAGAGYAISGFNDRANHVDVLAVFDRAIDLSEAS